MTGGANPHYACTEGGANGGLLQNDDGEHLKLVPSWRTGIFGVDMAGEALLPGPDARLLTTTFDAWLESEARVHA